MSILRRPKYQIEFFTSDWAVRTHYPIKPSKEVLPDHWKKMPSTVNGQDSVRKCPGIHDWLLAGYIIPAWTDIVVHQSEDLGSNGTLSNGNIGAGSHPPYQCLDLLVEKSHFTGTVKLPGTWSIKTAPGWSIMLVPLWYWHNQPWEALPGIIHSDNHHNEVNLNFVMKSKDPVVNIPAGTPLVQVIPFKRDSVQAVSRAKTDADIKRHGIILRMYNWTKNGITKFYKQQTSYSLDKKDLDFNESLKYPLE